MLKDLDFLIGASKATGVGDNNGYKMPRYHREDRAMRPMYESLATVTVTFPEIVNGHFLRSIVLKCVD